MIKTCHRHPGDRTVTIDTGIRGARMRAALRLGDHAVMTRRARLPRYRRMVESASFGSEHRSVAPD